MKATLSPAPPLAHNPGEVRFNRAGILGDVVAIKAKAGLKAQAVLAKANHLHVGVTHEHG